MLPRFILSGQVVHRPLQLIHICTGSGGGDPQVLDLRLQAAYPTLVVVDLIQQLAVLVSLHAQSAKLMGQRSVFVREFCVLRSAKPFRRELGRSLGGQTCTAVVCVCVGGGEAGRWVVGGGGLHA